MALDYSSLKDKYGGFRNPIIEIQVNGKSLTAGDNRKKAIGVSDVSVDLTAGFEASVASFRLYNVYNYEKTEFATESVKNFILLGSSVLIYGGYDNKVTEIFRGVITKVGFSVEENDVANISVTAMDMKAVMMANRYNKRLKATVYSEAVKEVFDQPVYNTMKDNGSIKSYSITATPDAGAAGAAGGVGGGAGGQTGENKTDKTIEMVGESDYEFLVKAAKKFNYEFFVLGGVVYFRKAKSDQTTEIVISPANRIQSLNVEYDMSGLVEQVEVRGLDVGKAKSIKEKQKNSNKVSMGSKAKSLFSGSKFVYVDPSVSASEDAKYRAEYLFQNMTYRYGSLEMDIAGLPEILPGKYIEISGLGATVSNKFYLMSVRHTFSKDGMYITHLVGKTDRQTNVSSL